MRFFLFLIFSQFFIYPVFSQSGTGSSLAELRTEIGRKNIYESQKLARIRQLKLQQNNTSKLNADAQYAICVKLYDEYKSYQYDSAYVYVNKLHDLSVAMNDMSRAYYSQIKLGFILLSSGMFKETFDCMIKVNPKLLNDSMKVEYYFILYRYNSDLAKYNSDKHFTPIYLTASQAYIDSAITFSKKGSVNWMHFKGIRDAQWSNNLNQVDELSNILTSGKPISMHMRAMVSCSLALKYLNANRKSEAIALLIQSAIADIKSSTKETVALFTLAEQLYKSGNTRDAYSFIKLAKADADFYGARQRKMQIGAILPLVAAEELYHSESEKRRIIIYLAAITGLASLVIWFLVMIYKQLNKVKNKERIIEEKNGQLKYVNDKLVVDTRIKEEYIGQFFKIISGYILKLEKLKMSVDTKLSIKKYEDIKLLINSINIKKEREVLYHSFDHIFLKIFPNFITVFNSLFETKDQIWPQEHEVLNTDLRIFALIRMGINDNETIAKILEYSVNTVYVYKMRIKAKSLDPEHFEQRIMDIKAVELIEL